MVCLCGSPYCECERRCICDREFCSCTSCHKLWKRACRQCGLECACLDLPESAIYSDCRCTDVQFQGLNFKKLPDLDFLSNKAECSNSNYVKFEGLNFKKLPDLDFLSNKVECSNSNVSAHSVPKCDSEADSENSLDKSGSPVDELVFQTDETDSSPDKNSEIRELAELSSESQSIPSLPSVTTLWYGESDAMNEYASNYQNFSSRVPHHSQSSTTSRPMSIESSPSSQCSVASSNRTVSAPAVINTGFVPSSQTSPDLPVRSISTSPRTGFDRTRTLFRDVQRSTDSRSDSMNEYASNYQNCSSRVPYHSQSSTTSRPMSIESSPSSQCSVASSNRTVSAPAVINTGFAPSSRTSPDLPVRSISTSPRTGFDRRRTLLRDVRRSTSSPVVRSADSRSDSPSGAHPSLNNSLAAD